MRTTLSAKMPVKNTTKVQPRKVEPKKAVIGAASPRIAPRITKSAVKVAPAPVEVSTETVKTVDVGLDLHPEFKPVSMDDIRKELRKRRTRARKDFESLTVMLKLTRKMK